MYTFPSRFAALGAKLSSFVGALLAATPYAERPVFRGFYFGGAGGHQPQALPAPQIEAKWSLERRLSAAAPAAEEGRSYFLQSLFPRIFFADRTLLTASVDTRLKRRLWLDIALGTTLVVCAALLIGFSYSFI
ncbi:MAG: hypothetical protein DMG07_29165, partial [Acidobacteria bacterium]